MPFEPTQSHPAMDALFLEWREALGPDYVAYRNHAFRVFNLAVLLASAQGADLDKLALAAAFHDIGIWLDHTFDYLEPSIARAKAYLTQQANPGWVADVENMIRQHHKLTPWRGQGGHLVEAFRRADWLDVCLFALPTKLPRAFLAELLDCFPRAGFHMRLVQLTASWTRRHPLRPLPMFKL